MTEIEKLIEKLKCGEIDEAEAERILKRKPFEDMGYAKVDTHRSLRQGYPEVIYGEGKTREQILGIAEKMLQSGQERILITRLKSEDAEFLENKKAIDFAYDRESRLGIVGGMPEPSGKGTVLVVTGGTSDIPVAEEAALTAQFHGSKVERLYDVGVSGLHRLLANMDMILDARVIVAVAGMEGALASVVGGLTDKPVIAVPTSVGYGASFEGMAALLSMLNSCASGVSVVNIDNGFGAGYLAGMINHM